MSQLSLLDVALEFYDFSEEANPQHVIACLSMCEDLSTADKSNVDTPWCAAGMCFALEKSGRKSPRTASAAKFVHFGNNIERKDLQIGNDIIVLNRIGGHHVTIFIREIGKRLFYGYGANQSNKWGFKQFEFAHAIAYRRIP